MVSDKIMITVFNDKKDADTFSDKIHQFLLKNRKGYNAERWSDDNYLDKSAEYIVKVPSDYLKFTDKITFTAKDNIKTQVIDAKAYIIANKTTEDIKEVIKK